MDINTHIDSIIESHRFEIRSRADPSVCPCYIMQEQCHIMENLNCFLCYCPWYDTSTPIGGCQRNSPDGKWFEHERLPQKKIWDCSDCTYPHTEDVVKEHLEKIFKSKNKSEKKYEKSQDC
jgi:Zn-finger protein